MEHRNGIKNVDLLLLLIFITDRYTTENYTMVFNILNIKKSLLRWLYLFISAIMCKKKTTLGSLYCQPLQEMCNVSNIIG